MRREQISVGHSNFGSEMIEMSSDVLHLEDNVSSNHDIENNNVKN